MSEQASHFIKGSLLHTIFHNEENMYTVARIRVLETTEDFAEKTVVITGFMPELYEQETYVFFGQFVHHPKYGKQYNVDHFERELPESRSGVVQYLSSKLFTGIGKRTAEAIVDTLGERAISKILNDKRVLDHVPKLSKEKADNLYETLKEHEGLERVMIALSDYGFGPQLSMKIYQTYKEEAIEVIQKNPYQLVYDIEGIGFKRADELGKTLDITGSHPDRIRAGALFCLTEKSLQEGHVFLYFEPYVASIKALLDGETIVEEEAISREIVHLDEEGKLILDNERVYLPSLYFAEKGLAANVKHLLKRTEKLTSYREADIDEAIRNLETKLSIQYADLQKKAIKTAIVSPLMILTGGPGTGKTTVIQGIVEIFADLNDIDLHQRHGSKDEPFPVVLAAPTGRAAKRMSEATNLPAQTIHRLLGWKGESFEHDEDEPIKGKLLIIDEVSMVDIWLANQLFKSLPEDIQVVLVGDEDQLPSVQPGQVLKDLLESAVIPTVQLKSIYRQKDGSSIVQFAHHIKKGELPADFGEATSDRRFFPCRPDNIGQVVEQICQHALNKGFTVNDIQVLAPMYKGKAGVEQLNARLQKMFNPESEQRRQIRSRDYTYRVGDKVLQLVNDMENQVFNGDIGFVTAIKFAKETVDKEDQLIVTFEGKEVVYPWNKLHQLTLAYCCSIHKSQGSEFPIVILPVVRGFYRMLKRNIIYTAVTRSKRYLLMCGEEEALRMAVENRREDVRHSLLKEKLKEQMG